MPEFAAQSGDWAVTGPLTKSERAERPSEWHEPSSSITGAARALIFVSETLPQSVFVAGLVSPLLLLVNQSHVSFEGIEFTDADYRYTGVQASFNSEPTAAGSPADGALAISGSHDVNITNCSFRGLSGGGVLLANASADCNVLGSRFEGLGQSGVMLVGDAMHTTPTDWYREQSPR